MKPDAFDLTPAVSGVFEGTKYSIYGAGEPVVLIHGVGMEQAVWAPQVLGLSSQYQVITYDMLGHGGSRIPPDDVTLADYAAQLAQLLDHLQVSAATVVGHSMGALVALEFAIRYPQRTKRLAALNAVFMRSPEQRAAVMQRAQALQHTGVAATIDSTIERWFGNPVPADLVSAAQCMAALMTRVNPVGYARSYAIFARSDEVHADSLATLTMPVLFMTGEFDPNSSPAMSEAMARLVPNASLDIVKDARHMMSVTSAERINQGLREFFLRSLPVKEVTASNQA